MRRLVVLLAGAVLMAASWESSNSARVARIVQHQFAGHDFNIDWTPGPSL